jgi:hypothetical protein
MRKPFDETKVFIKMKHFDTAFWAFLKIFLGLKCFTEKWKKMQIELFRWA